MADRLKGKVAFCTASGAGIGRATAVAFAQEGARVIASDLNDASFAELKAAGVAECVKLDARDSAAIAAQAKRIGPVDVLFNAAGFVHHGTVLECSDEDWDFSFDLNVKSMHRTIKAFLPGMLTKGGGSIINIASTAGASKAVANRYAYGATKAAVVGLHQVGGVRFHQEGHSLIAEKLGPAFDLLFKFIIDPPPTPTAKNAAAFTRWVEAHDLPPIGFYSAYPGLQVQDVRELLAY